MSINVTNASIKEFDALVKQIYQAIGWILRGTMRTRMNVVGSQIRFTVQDKGIASEKAPQDDVVLMNIDYTNVEATLKNFTAADLSDIFAQQEINFDEKRELATTIAMSIGRRSDQISIDALDASSTTSIIADGGVGFTFDKIRETIKFLHKNGITRQSSDIHIAISPESESDLLDETKLTSTDFIRQQIVQSGGIDGVRVHATFLSGYIWAENVGWVNIGDGSPANGICYANVDDTDFVVNIDPTTGDLFGYAWGGGIEQWKDCGLWS